jgi:hypothetical protein
VIDLKRFGVRPFVDAARVLALAHACTATSTVERLRALAAAGKLQAREVTEWADAFSFVQGLRMRAQERSRIASAPNAVAIDDLSPMDARILKECFDRHGNCSNASPWTTPDIRCSTGSDETTLRLCPAPTPAGWCSIWRPPGLTRNRTASWRLVALPCMTARLI